MAGFSFCLFSMLCTRAIRYYYIREQWHLFKNEHILCARCQCRDYCRGLNATKGSKPSSCPRHFANQQPTPREVECKSSLFVGDKAGLGQTALTARYSLEQTERRGRETGSPVGAPSGGHGGDSAATAAHRCAR